MLFQKFLVIGIIVVLLTQQYAAPSADLGEKVDEKRPPRRFSLGQGVVERAGQPVLGRGRRQGEKSKQTKDDGCFPHLSLPN